MTLALNLTLAEEVRLYTAARQKRVEPTDLLKTLIREHLPSVAPEENISSDDAQAKTPHDRAQAFRAWAESHSRSIPLLSEEAISRESIYGERG